MKLGRYYFYFIFFIAATTVVLWLKVNSQYRYEHSRNAVIQELKGVSHLKYILVWTNPARDPIYNLGKGMESFVRRRCPEFNCFVSSDRDFFGDPTKFDLVIFHATEVANAWIPDFPKARSPHQKYVFSSMESSDYYPLCDKKFDSFFNWTWTCKLDSDEVYGYITIKNKVGKIIGPKEEMHWMKLDEMQPIGDEIKGKLSGKKTAAAWFVSNCKARNGRFERAKELETELQVYGLTLDIFGSCGTKSCSYYKMDECRDIIERDYYFYLAFENSFSEDYVTEKLLNGLKHYAVPVVFGGANYTRFMPDGIYLDARALSVKEVARLMAEAILDQDTYYNYFKWHNHYSYHNVDEFPESDGYCNLCALANNEELFTKSYSYDNFTGWWNPPDRC